MEKNDDNNKSEVALKEEEILRFWNNNNIFKKSLEKDSPKGEFVFYDGPPFATGTPHYGHLLPGTMKDVIPRFKTMQGYHVQRRWGWDCHGLPIENLIEKELGLESKKAIEDYGIEKFNKAARDSVLRYEKVWKETIPRVGRWVDMDDPYMSMQPSFMETGFWIFKNLYDKDLISKGFKSMHMCPRCETTLANFEVNQGYKDVKDISVTVKFELVDEPGTFLLAWTTTPWTLPGNVALAVGADIDYVKVKQENEFYILAKELVSVIEGEYEIVDDRKGSDLVGKKYKPVFDYYSKSVEKKERGWTVYSADFVTTEEGTGIVHIAPAFGSDDMELGKKEDLPFIQHVHKNGQFKDEVKDFSGLFVKKKDDLTSTDVEIIKYLAHNGKLFSKKKIEHSYPHCWRCDTPLINYATSSWFMDVPSIKSKLLKNNKTTKWVPENLRDGRFGKWLEGAREWALSRSRFWGTPLPVWESEDEKETLVIGSVEELKKYTKRSGNKYFVMRHGEAEHNAGGFFNSNINTPVHLTEEGKKQCEVGGEYLKEKNIDLIFQSPFIRTRETSEIVARVLGLPKDKIITDERISELNAGDIDGKNFKHFFEYRDDSLFSYDKKFPNGESYQDAKNRIGEFIYELENKYKDKNILIVSHGIFAEVLSAIMDGDDKFKSLEKVYEKGMNRGEVRELDFVPLPHNENYELDLHRPYIDQIEIEKNGKKMKRVEEVFDVWFDSGSMPYAQKHYPFSDTDFDPKGGLFKKTKGFPADFIAEGLDQTRGWFYVLMVLGTALFDKSPFKNVAVNGLVLAEDGKKMSKRLKNYPELSSVVDNQGADALRLFLMSSPAVRGEDVNFSEKVVSEVQSKVMGRLRNSTVFYKMYADGTGASDDSKNILDRWIISRLYETVKTVEDNLKEYFIDRAARPLFDFVDDLSTWYVRRSRDRFKGEDKKDSIATMRFVLREFAKVSAPFIPFVAEEVYLDVKDENEPESVHLCGWPKTKNVNQEILDDMKKARDIVSLGLLERQKVDIKVRQPLQSLTINEKLGEKYLDVIKDEVNVKEVLIGDEIKIDSNITPELQKEGDYRDFLRSVQSLRKEMSLEPSDLVMINIPEKNRDVVSSFEDDFKKVAGVKEINWGGEEIKLYK